MCVHFDDCAVRNASFARRLAPNCDAGHAGKALIIECDAAIELSRRLRSGGAAKGSEPRVQVNGRFTKETIIAFDASITRARAKVPSTKGFW